MNYDLLAGLLLLILFFIHWYKLFFSAKDNKDRLLYATTAVITFILITQCIASINRDKIIKHIDEEVVKRIIDIRETIENKEEKIIKE